MEIRVSVLGKVAYKENETREDAEKAELYPFGEGLYAVMDGEIFVALRVVSGKKHSDEKGDYYACVDNYWGHGKISNSATIIEHEERLKDLCGVEPLDICRCLDFNIGNAIKYLLRKDKVDGNKTKTEKRIEDLRKAVFYIQDEIKLLEHGTD